MSRFDTSDHAQWPTPDEAYGKRPKVSASLQDSSDSSKTPSDKVADAPPIGYYVIIGCGLAAVLNHTTLRQTTKGKARMSDPAASGVTLPLLHIGFEDPWRTYHAHGMGQPPYLLCMPGLHGAPPPDADARAIRTGMRSTEFAGITKDEWDLLADTFKFGHYRAWAAVIQPRGADEKGNAIDDAIITAISEEGLNKSKISTKLNTPYPAAYPPYRILVVPPSQQLDFIYAHKIDICTGAGRPTVPNFESCKEARTKLWTAPAKWDEPTQRRTIVTGPEALCTFTPWKEMHRVCVFGAGGIGLNMVERAEDEGCCLDWLPNPMPAVRQYPAATTLHRSFNLPRNDTVLKNPKLPTGDRADKCMNPGESGVRDANLATNNLHVALYPCKPEWRFARHTDLGGVETSGGIVKVTVAHYPPTNGTDAAAIADRDESITELKDGTFAFSKWYAEQFPALDKKFPDKKTYHRLFVTSGLVMNTNTDGGIGAALGTPITLAAAVTFDRITVGGRFVGLQSTGDGGLVRVLGAASSQHPSYAMVRDDATTLFFQSLPFSAVQPGFIYSGVVIAAANGWFDDPTPNRNLNTIEQNDLIRMLTAHGMTPDHAKKLGGKVVKARRAINGYRTLDDVKSVVRADVSLGDLGPSWETALDNFATAYPIGRDFWSSGSM